MPMAHRRRLLPVLLLLCLSLAAPAFAQGGEGQPPAPDGQSTIHVVQRGETLFRIALQYGTSVEAITQSNGITDPTAIQAGQRLIIPNGVVSATVPTGSQHLVQPGETLAHIALRYGSTPDLIAALNDIVNPAQLVVGQALDVSATAAGRAPVTHGYTHVVQPGETLYRIALRYGANLDAIRQANDLAAPTLIYPGQHLLIPAPDATNAALQDLPAPLTSLALAALPATVGRSFSVRITAAQSVTLSGTFLDRPLHFANDGGTYYALYGVQALTEPGVYPLAITVQDASGITS
ncbi:MAG: LysM peptidoglycan-binding domain-containing protein, partial [Anaerolineae bacterium]|nr:LysM peptidoglycan-binding domain-containing protein [Anaerolineae bacterium]